MGKLSATVIVAAMAALAVAATASSWSRQVTLETAAARFTGLKPAVVCETALEHAQGVKAGGTEYLAFARATRPGLIVLSPPICAALRRSELGSSEFAHAVYVLAHELGHIVNRTKDETAAECYAVARWRDLGALLGLATATADQVSRVVVAHDRLPARYRGSCPTV